MEIKRKTEIFVETRRRFVVSQAETAENVFCAQCGEPMLTAEQTAGILEVGRRAVYQMVENGTSHFIETKTGVLMVCPTSIAGSLTKQK